MADTRSSVSVSAHAGPSNTRLAVTPATLDNPATIQRRPMATLLMAGLAGQYCDRPYCCNKMPQKRIGKRSISQIGKSYCLGWIHRRPAFLGEWERMWRGVGKSGLSDAGGGSDQRGRRVYATRTIWDMARYFVAFLMSCQRAPV